MADVSSQLQIQNKDHVEHGDLEELRSEVAKLGNALMDLEMRQVEQFEDIMNEFEVGLARARGGPGAFVP